MTKEIESRIGEIIGEASMCWSETPTSVFESTHANKLVAELTTLVEDVRKEERRFFEPEVKLTKFLRKEGHNNLALWIETQNEKYLELSLGLPVGSLDKFEREALTLPTK